MATAQQLFWTRLNHSVTSFCLEVTQSRTEPENKIVSSLVGEELEWCGSHSFLFMASRYLSTVRKIQEAEQKLKALESSLTTEMQNVVQLRKQLKQAQLAAEDNDWQLQEQLAHASNQLHLEKETNSELKGKLASTQAKLIEVEMFLSSENGAFALQLEEALAAAKMKIAELEAEKDDLELQMRSNRSSRHAVVGDGKENNSTEAVPPSLRLSVPQTTTTESLMRRLNAPSSSSVQPSFSFGGLAKSLLEE